MPTTRENVLSIVNTYRIILCMKLMSGILKLAPNNPEGDEIILGIARITERMSRYDACPHKR